MTKIIYFDVDDDEKDFLERENNGKYDYKLVGSPLTPLLELDEDEKNAEIISCFTTSRVSADVLKQFHNLKLIALRSVGFNHVDYDYCKSHNIFIENTPNYGNKSVAEFAIGLLLDVSRKISKAYDSFKEMTVCPQQLVGSELGGKTIGVVGLGAIGSEFARLAYGFDMNILGYDLVERKELTEKYNVRCSDFDTL